MSIQQENETQERNPEPKRFRFGLKHLFYGIALIASGLAVMGPSSILVSAIVVAIWATAFRQVGTVKKIDCLIAIFLLAILGAVLFFPTLEEVRESSRRTACINNLRQLILSVHNYESAYGHFPQAVVQDDDGIPKHSWRALVRPFIDTGLWIYRFNEPWNGPNNILLAGARPPCFHCYSSGPLGNKTTYKLVTGPGTAFPTGSSITFEDVADGSSKTIALIEDCHNPVPWLQPVDVGIDDAIKAITDRSSQHARRSDSLFKTEYYGTHVALLDGSVISINPRADPELLRKAMLIDNDSDPDDLIERIAGSHIVHKPQGYLALITYLGLLGLPGYFLWQKRADRNKWLGNPDS